MPLDRCKDGIIGKGKYKTKKHNQSSCKLRPHAEKVRSWKVCDLQIIDSYGLLRVVLFVRTKAMDAPSNNKCAFGNIAGLLILLNMFFLNINASLDLESKLGNGSTRQMNPCYPNLLCGKWIDFCINFRVRRSRNQINQESAIYIYF